MALLEQTLEQVERAAAAELWDEVCDGLPWLLAAWEGAEKPAEIAERLAQVMGAVVTLGDTEARRAVSRLWCRLGMPGVVALTEILLDGEEDFHGRWLAGRSLGELGAAGMTEARDVVLGLLADQQDDETLAIAAGAITHMGAPAIQALSDLLSSAETRPAAVRSLVKICHPDIVTPLLTVMGDPDPQLRAIALEAIGTFQDRRSLPVLLTALEDTASLVRREAVRGLGQKAKLILKGESAGIEDSPVTGQQLEMILIERLDDFSLEVSQQAAIALGRLQTPRAIAVLTTTLSKSSTPTPLRKILIQALVWTDSPIALDALATYLSTFHPIRAQDTVEDGETIQTLIQMLGRVTGEAPRSHASAILQTWWRAVFPPPQTPPSERLSHPIREAIAQSLGQLSHPDSHPILKTLAEDEIPSVRYRAEAALRRLHSNPES